MHPCALLVGTQIGAATVESSVEFPQKIKSGSALWPSNSTSENISKETSNTNSQEYMHPMLTESLFKRSRAWALTDWEWVLASSFQNPNRKINLKAITMIIELLKMKCKKKSWLKAFRLERMVRFLQCIVTGSWTIKRNMVTTCSPLNRNWFELKDKEEKLARGFSILYRLVNPHSFWFSNHGVSLSLKSNLNNFHMSLGLNVNVWRGWMLRHTWFKSSICVPQHCHLSLLCLLYCFIALWKSTL